MFPPPFFFTAPPLTGAKSYTLCLRWTLLTALLSGLTFSAGLAQIPSGPTDITRYQKIWEISPFVAVTDLSGQADDMAGRFALTGFARMGNKDVVFIFDRTSLERFALTPGDSRNGVSLQSLQHQGDLRTVRVTLNAGGRVLEVGYDPSVMPEVGPGQTAVIPENMGYPSNMQRTFPGQPIPPGQPGVPAMPGGPFPPNLHDATQGGFPGQQPNPRNPHAIIGAPPAAAMPAQEAPPPRRVIRRRAIVVNE